MRITIFTTVLFLLAAIQIYAQQECDRACLTAVIDSYFEGLTAYKAQGVPLAEEVRITENGFEKSLTDTFWDQAKRIAYRWDIVNTRLGDTGTEAVVVNEDGTYTMLMLRLKVKNHQITEVETIRVNKDEAGFLWDPERLVQAPLSKELTQTYREADRDSYYGLIAAAESYWRAFQTTGTEDYHPASLSPDAQRFENGFHTCGHLPDGSFHSAREEFDRGDYVGFNLWDRRYAVVDEERGIVLCILRFGAQYDRKDQITFPQRDGLVGEFFTVKNGMIQEIHALLLAKDDAEPTGWETQDYGPGMGGW